MKVNMDNKFCEVAEYFYNEYIDMYCVIGTTLSAESLNDIKKMFACDDLLKETDMPEYITEDYNGAEW